MNLALVPRPGPFPQLRELNGQSITYDDVDLALREANVDAMKKNLARYVYPPLPVCVNVLKNNTIVVWVCIILALMCGIRGPKEVTTGIKFLPHAATSFSRC